MNEKLMAEIEVLKQNQKLILGALEALTEEVAGKPKRREPPVKEAKPKTPWRPTKNPKIEWCPEREAAPSDVAKAKDRDNSNYWWRGGLNGYGASIFKRLRG